MRTLFRGLIVGALLSCLRAPLGIELLQTPVVDARVTYGYRALALAAIAIALWFSAIELCSTGFLFACTFGFAVHALLLANLWSPAGHATLVATCLAGSIGLALLRRRADEHSAATNATPRASLAEMLGLALAGAGAAIAIEGVARHVRLFGSGLAQDDSLSACVLLFAIAFGSGAFGWIARAASLRAISSPIALAFSAAGCFVSLSVLTSIANRSGLDAYLRRYQLDLAQHGMLGYDALIAGSCFVAPAFLLGLALHGTRGRERTLSVLLGAAVGLYSIPSLIGSAVDALADDKGVFSAELIPLGTLIAIAGAVLALLSLAERRARARWIAIAVVLLASLLPLRIKVRPQPVFSPWLPRPVFPLLVLDSPAGLISVEPTRGGFAMVSLDRHDLSPSFEDATADAQRLALALDSTAHAKRAQRALNVLLVGQLTPARAKILTDGGAARIDRTGAWSDAMERIEATLFESSARPSGEIIASGPARQRIADGAYDLVLVPPVPGDVPHLGELDTPRQTAVVTWFEIDQPAQQRDFPATWWLGNAGRIAGSKLMLAADGMDHPCLAVVDSAFVAPDNDPGGPLRLDAGRARLAPSPLRWLCVREFERTNASRASMLERLAQAAEGGRHAELTAGLALFYRMQQLHSPFESKEQNLRLPDEVLELLETAALREPPNEFVRQLWESLARVLGGKRWVEQIYRFVEPLATKYPPWPALERVLAMADLESLEPQSALKRLEALSVHEAGSFEVWYYLGEAQTQLGDHQGACVSWKRALELIPDHALTRRKLAMALVRAHDPEGVKRVNELLAEEPEDEELRVFLGSGPYPAPSPTFSPGGHSVHPNSK